MSCFLRLALLLLTCVTAVPDRSPDKHLSQPRNRSPLRSMNGNILQRPLGSLSRRRPPRDLSNIQEASETSAAPAIRRRRTLADLDGASRRTASCDNKGKGRLNGKSSGKDRPPARAPRPITIATSSGSSSSLPLKVPERRSSASFFKTLDRASRDSSIQDFPSWRLPPPAAGGYAVPHRGRSVSPLRQTVERDPISSDGVRKMQSRTFIRANPPYEILDVSSSKHDRFEFYTHLPSPIFVGGGTVEGSIRLSVDRHPGGKPKGPMYISRLSVDIVGVEEVADGRRWIFLNLASELFDKNHPPPVSIVSSQNSISPVEWKWTLKPSSANIPFYMNLPLNVGPPPYSSKNARIRYLLCPTAVLQVAGQTQIVRQSWDVQMLTVHDPEKALSSLPSPLIASDTLTLSLSPGFQYINLTAGLHRQTWVNGSKIFVDVHISNRSHKTLKKLELQLQKTTLWYAHAAAGTAEKSASHLRLPHKSDIDVIATSVLKKGKTFEGVAEHSSDVRTIDLDVPRDHITISTGRYFEIRYFVNVIVSVGHFKSIAVQLPVTIIHMNSLDIVPNSLAQVAAAIEAKRARTVPVREMPPSTYPPYHQGQAFTAPRRQSLEQARAQAVVPAQSHSGTEGVGPEEIDDLRNEVDESSRRAGTRSENPDHGHHSGRSLAGKLTRLRSQELLGANGRLSTAMDGQESDCEIFVPDEETQPSLTVGNQFHHQHHRRQSNCYRCQIPDLEPITATSAKTVGKRAHHRSNSIATSNITGGTGADTPRRAFIPRLQLSTSGLGFSETEFELSPDLPSKKVMLSEEERELIKFARQRNLARNSGEGHEGYSAGVEVGVPGDRPSKHGYSQGSHARVSISSLRPAVRSREGPRDMQTVHGLALGQGNGHIERTGRLRSNTHPIEGWNRRSYFAAAKAAATGGRLRRRASHGGPYHAHGYGYDYDRGGGYDDEHSYGYDCGNGHMMMPSTAAATGGWNNVAIPPRTNLMDPPPYDPAGPGTATVMTVSGRRRARRTGSMDSNFHFHPAAMHTSAATAAAASRPTTVMRGGSMRASTGIEILPDNIDIVKRARSLRRFGSFATTRHRHGESSVIDTVASAAGVGVGPDNGSGGGPGGGGMEKRSLEVVRRELVDFVGGAGVREGGDRVNFRR